MDNIEEVPNVCGNEYESLDIEFTSDGKLMVHILSQSSKKIMIKYLIDSGACFNALSWESARELGHSSINYNDKITLSGFDGTLSKTIGSIYVNLNVGKSLYAIKFYILKTLSVPGIIGASFLRKYTLGIGKKFEKNHFQKNINENEKEKGSEEASMNEEDCTLIDNQEKNELISHMEKQLSDCDVVETSKEEELVGSERYTELVNKVNFTHLDSTKTNIIQQIIAKYTYIFHLPGVKLTFTKAAMHEIETNSNIPIYKRQYRFPAALNNIMEEQIEEMLKQKIIRPSKSSWNAPVMCIPKKSEDDQ